ncbi:MAG TPA: molybdopterin-dependent oxidoreductase [Bryobacteraceae bacterium]|jgi:DMSO/TMAO reductase YedYZ molybdopterin-dependent catalytic subunit|nr:molybdopterin-dependent oxidoreductase [Bryobacteraceae bacterium]
MTNISRRKLITTGLALGAGASGLAVADRLARRYGLVAPDSRGLLGPGKALTYAAQRLITGHSLAREFPRNQISKTPFANGDLPRDAAFQQMQERGFSDWRLAVDGLVKNPVSFSVSELKSFPSRSQITHVACEEGWSYIAEWIGVPLSHVLSVVETLPQARYVVYFSMDRDWWDSVDMSDALHPQTFITYGMNDSELPTSFGGPLRLRVPRQLGYKSVKYITRLTVTDSLKSFGRGMGSQSAQSTYSWYAGI